VTTHHVAGGDQSFFAEVQDCYVRWDPETPTDGATAGGAVADVPSSGEEPDVWNGRQPVRYSPCSTSAIDGAERWSLAVAESHSLVLPSAGR
jgi:hypothetical protein